MYVSLLDVHLCKHLRQEVKTRKITCTISPEKYQAYLKLRSSEGNELTLGIIDSRDLDRNIFITECNWNETTRKKTGTCQKEMNKIINVKILYSTILVMTDICVSADNWNCYWLSCTCNFNSNWQFLVLKSDICLRNTSMLFLGNYYCLSLRKPTKLVKLAK